MVQVQRQSDERAILISVRDEGLDDTTYLAGRERVLDGMRKAGVPEV
jgi:hypothetical protein